VITTEAFDVVVVGGGAAGCVVAARLAQPGSRSVLLLEAGPDLRAATPDGFLDGWDISPSVADWGYTSAPGPRGNVRNLWRTRALGGTSWLTRFAPRGAPSDYDGWPAPWTFADVLPYFRRLEADVDFGHEPWHGESGPMPVSRYLHREYTEPAAAVLRALHELGLPPVDDHNRPGAVGAGRMPMSSTGGRRATTVDAYLPLGGTPANLTIRAETQVAQVLFDGTRARGVQLLDGSTVEAGHVVLCAGVYGDPPLLMRSGVGPAEHLRSVEIPVRVDLPGVGENLADHPAVDLDSGYRGPPAAAPVMHLMATLRASGTRPDAPPDLMLWCSDPDEDGLFEITVVLLKPRSRGRVRLRSADPAAAPQILLPALSEHTDVARLAEGYRLAVEVANHREVRAHCDDPAPTLPGADELPARIRDEAASLPHVVGTCAMGAVVDPYGRVHGTQALTIADASIMPDVPSGFTHFPTIMIAERLSETIAESL
jgi:choline dehydrogenase